MRWQKERSPLFSLPGLVVLRSGHGAAAALQNAPRDNGAHDAASADLQRFLVAGGGAPRDPQGDHPAVLAAMALRVSHQHCHGPKHATCNRQIQAFAGFYSVTAQGRTWTTNSALLDPRRSSTSPPEQRRRNLAKFDSLIAAPGSGFLPARASQGERSETARFLGALGNPPPIYRQSAKHGFVNGPSHRRDPRSDPRSRSILRSNQFDF
ncbi:uncharacterized protein TrAFT101_004517 [Trichoderma asperellum]|uniref:uncharacterized protein n=1 Tax=Trichoderma asperellum TaxID=101201 RepID=UPI003318D078|nr:hypothetical protein TrAFT101_004517 [Trichoderma asperellum]